MELNEYIIIICGNASNVFIGSNAKEEAFNKFVELVSGAFAHKLSDKVYLGYYNNEFSVQEVKDNFYYIFDSIINNYGQIKYGGFTLEIYSKGCNKY